MANKTYYSVELSERKINQPEAYRIKLSYGTFSVSPQLDKRTNRHYCYANKRINGRLIKRYVGKYGDLTIDDVHQACYKISTAARRL